MKKGRGEATFHEGREENQLQGRRLVIFICLNKLNKLKPTLANQNQGKFPKWAGRQVTPNMDEINWSHGFYSDMFCTILYNIFALC